MKRRNFIKNNSLIVGGLLITPSVSIGKEMFSRAQFVSNRPEVAKRTFTSEAVEKLIAEVKAKIADKEVAWMFENCYPNTLDTTVDYEPIDGKPDTLLLPATLMRCGYATPQRRCGLTCHSSAPTKN